MWKRTTETQTEKTPTGIITTVKETQGKRTRYVQIGYTSISKKHDKEFIDGPIGQDLLRQIQKAS